MNTTEDRTLTETIENALIVRGFGPKTAHDAAGIAAAAVHFHAEQERQPYTGPEDLVGVLSSDDGIDQGVSRLTMLAILADDRDLIRKQIDDERVEITSNGDTLSFPYRGHRMLVEYEPKAAELAHTFAKVKLLHSLPFGGARYATWSVIVGTDNAAHAVPILREIDAIIDAERAEVFA